MGKSLKLFKNTVSNVGFKIITMGLGFISLPIVIANVGVEEYGLLTLSNTIIGYFFLFNMGFPTGVTKYIAEYQAQGKTEEVNDVINSSILFYIIIGFTVMILVTGFVYFGGVSVFNITEKNRDTAETMLYLAAVWSFFSWPLNNLLEGIFKGYQEFPKFNISNASGVLLSYVITITLALFEQHIIVIQLGQFSAALLRWSIQFYLLKNITEGYKINFSQKVLKKFKTIFSFSSQILLQKIFDLVTNRSHNIIIGVFLSVEMVTAFVVVRKTYIIIQNISSMTYSALMPFVSDMKARNEDVYLKKLFFKGSQLNNIVISILIVTLFLITPAFLNLYLGDQFNQYATISQIYLLSLFLTHTRAFLGPYAIGIGQVKILTRISVFNSTLQLISSILLVNIIGFDGIIYSFFIKGAGSVILGYKYLMPSIDISGFEYFKKVFLKAEFPIIVVGAFLYLGHEYFYSVESWTVLLLIASSIGVLLLVFSIIFLLDKNDKKFISSKIPIVKTH